MNFRCYTCYSHSPIGIDLKFNHAIIAVASTVVRVCWHRSFWFGLIIDCTLHSCLLSQRPWFLRLGSIFLLLLSVRNCFLYTRRFFLCLSNGFEFLRARFLGDQNWIKNAAVVIHWFATFYSLVRLTHESFSFRSSNYQIWAFWQSGCLEMALCSARRNSFIFT